MLRKYELKTFFYIFIYQISIFYQINKNIIDNVILSLEKDMIKN